MLSEDPADYLDQFKVQAVHLTKAFVPAMQQAGYGRIVGLSTECVMQNKVNQSAYVAGKRGMDGYGAASAEKLAKTALPSIKLPLAGRCLTTMQTTTMNTTSPMCPWVVAAPATRSACCGILGLAPSQFYNRRLLPVCGGYVLPAI